MSDDPFFDLAQFADKAREKQQIKSRNRCALCNVPAARRAALQHWENGVPSTIIADWLAERYNLHRAPRTIRDCLNKHKGV